MAGEFVKVEVETDAQTLASNAVDNLRVSWEGWEPEAAGDLSVIQIESLAPMAANVAETAARVPPAVFREYGQKMVGIPYDPGTPATTTVTFHLTDTLGHRIPAGAQVDIDGVAFAVDDDVDIAAGVDTAAGVTVTATVSTSEGNDLVGDVVTPISALAFVESVTVDTPTAGGSDTQTDAEYNDTLSRRLRLRAETLVTPRDFELAALDEPGVGRALALHNGERNITVVVTDPDGEVVIAPIKDRLVERYADFRLVNTVVTVTDPTYTTVNIAYTVKAYPGFDADDLEARINASLTESLQPGAWGQPRGFGDPGSPNNIWVNDTVVRVNKIIDMIGDVEGVDYVTTVTINGSAADLTLTGTVPLTRAGTMTGTIT